MHLRSALPLALSGTILACILQKSDDVEFWAKNDHVALGLGMSLMMTFSAGGWVLITKEDEGGQWRAFIAYMTSFIAILFLGAYFLVISKMLMQGFAIGQFAVGMLVLVAEKAEWQDRRTRAKSLQLSDSALSPSPPASVPPPAE